MIEELSKNPKILLRLQHNPTTVEVKLHTFTVNTRCVRRETTEVISTKAVDASVINCFF